MIIIISIMALVIVFMAIEIATLKRGMMLRIDTMHKQCLRMDAIVHEHNLMKRDVDSLKQLEGID